MTRIVISDLYPTSLERSPDSDSFLEDLTEEDATFVHGGEGYGFDEFLAFGVRALEYALVGFAIYNIVSLVQSFLAPHPNRSNSSHSVPPIAKVTEM